MSWSSTDPFTTIILPIRTIFQDDNAAIHMAEKVHPWFENQSKISSVSTIVKTTTKSNLKFWDRELRSTFSTPMSLEQSHWYKNRTTLVHEWNNIQRYSLFTQLRFYSAKNRSWSKRKLLLTKIVYMLGVHIILCIPHSVKKYYQYNYIFIYDCMTL